MMKHVDESQQRRQAVTRYLTGEKVTAITRSLEKSRKWFYEWFKRYEADPYGDWWVEQSRAPINRAKKTNSELIGQILQIRRELMNEKMAQTGAISVLYELQRRGVVPLPAIWTINRVIAQAGLNKKSSQVSGDKPYPDLFWHTHQLDLVGPRHIKGDGSFYNISIIDVTTRTCFVKAVRTKESAEIVEALAEFWQLHGMPDALQLDNELAFRGSNQYPRSFGAVIRFALSQGVAPVFIPMGEPWRNGIIEKFNDTYQKKFLRAYTFTSLEHLQEQEGTFRDFHNANHRYSSQLHRTPNEMVAQMLPAARYSGNAHLRNRKGKVCIPLITGCIYYIRYIRSDLILRINNETFKVDSKLKYYYVIAEVNIDLQCINIRLAREVVQTIPFWMPAVEW